MSTLDESKKASAPVREKAKGDEPKGVEFSTSHDANGCTYSISIPRHGYFALIDFSDCLTKAFQWTLVDSKEDRWSDEYDLDVPGIYGYGIMNMEALDIKYSWSFTYSEGQTLQGEGFGGKVHVYIPNTLGLSSEYVEEHLTEALAEYRRMP